MSPDLDFETRLIAKTNAAQVLEEQFFQAWLSMRADQSSAPTPTRISRSSANTKSPAKPLEVLLRYRHPGDHHHKRFVLILRDLDLLAELALAETGGGDDQPDHPWMTNSNASLNPEHDMRPKARLRAIRVSCVMAVSSGRAVLADDGAGRAAARTGQAGRAGRQRNGRLMS